VVNGQLEYKHLTVERFAGEIDGVSSETTSSACRVVHRLYVVDAQQHLWRLGLPGVLPVNGRPAHARDAAPRVDGYDS
jgi:hypothetical protein